MKNAFLTHFTRDSIFFYVLAVFILTLPYNISTWWIGTFSITLVLLTLSNPYRHKPIQSTFQDQVFQALIVFIFFTYISVLWSQSPDLFNGDLKTNIGRFKYLFLIAPAIFLSNLTRSDIRKLFIVIALAPSLSIIIYYTNYLSFSSIFPAQDYGNNSILRHYLRQNFFILFSILYLYIHIFTITKSGEYKKLLIYIPLFLVTSISLFLDERTDSRLIDLAYILTLISVPIFYLKPKIYLALIIIMAGVSITVVSSPQFQKGIMNFRTAIDSDTYTGSWGHRLGYAIVGIEIFKEHPFIGRGINNITQPIEKIAKSHPKYFIGENLKFFHNEHINILVATGIVGYLLLLYFLFIFYRLKIDDKEIYVFKNITVLILFFIMIGDHYLSVKETVNFFFIIVALAVTYNNINKQDTRHHT